MRSFDEIFELAVGHHGDAKSVESQLPKTKSAAAFARLGDDRILSAMTRSVFQAGFNWKVIEAKWEGFEAAFEGFEPKRWAVMSDADLDRLVKDTRIVRNAQKILSVPGNAAMILSLAADHGSAARAIAEWPATDFVGLLEHFKKHGARLGGATSQYCLRQLGRDGFILSRDVTAALIREGVVDKAPTSRAGLKATQEAFDRWCAESGRTLAQVSRVLSLSVGPS